jgi:DNA-binding response OmpR family regulator
MKKRCLVVSTNESLIATAENMLRQIGYNVDIVKNRKNALEFFLLHKHYLLLLDAEFLPKHPYRLIQLFKMAHRNPGVLILSKPENDLTGYTCLQGGIIRIINTPFKTERLLMTLKQTCDSLTMMNQSLFFKDLLIYASLCFPVVLVLMYLLVNR